jgi:hypothetical protein
VSRGFGRIERGIIDVLREAQALPTWYIAWKIAGPFAQLCPSICASVRRALRRLAAKGVVEHLPDREWALAAKAARTEDRKDHRQKREGEIFNAARSAEVERHKTGKTWEELFFLDVLDDVLIHLRS